MRLVALLVLALLAAMIPISAMAQKRETIPGTQQRVGGPNGWDTWAWKEGSRSGCSMYSNYDNGGGMGFTTEGEQWRISWSHPNWRFTKDQTVAVTYWVDGSPPRSIDTKVEADATGGLFVWGVLPDSPELFDQFRSGAVLHIRVPGNALNYRLTATNVALANLRSCAATYKGTGAPASTAGAGPTPAVATLPALTADQRVEAIRLAANLLTRLPGFRLLNEEEQKALAPMVATLKAAVVWRGDKTFGMLHIIPNATEADIPKIAGGMLGAIVPVCKGGDVNASVTTDVRSSAVRRVHISCSAGEAQSLIRVILMPFKDGVYYLSAGADDPKDEAAVLRAEELLRNALFEVTQK